MRPNNKSKKAPISQGLFVLLRGEDLNLRPSGHDAKGASRDDDGESWSHTDESDSLPWAVRAGYGEGSALRGEGQASYLGLQSLRRQRSEPSRLRGAKRDRDRPLSIAVLRVGASRGLDFPADFGYARSVLWVLVARPYSVVEGPKGCDALRHQLSRRGAAEAMISDSVESRGSAECSCFSCPPRCSFRVVR